MKAFKFNEAGGSTICIAAETQLLAEQYYREEFGNEHLSIEEVPEKEMSVQNITVYPDNDFNKKPFLCSIRELISGTEPQFVLSTNPDFI